MTAEQTREDLDRRIDAIEAAYEYFLAYAAQGRTTDRSQGGAASEVRKHLENMQTALAGLADVARKSAAAKDAGLVANSDAFFEAVGSDAEVARGAVSLVLARADISSQLIDNLNASIHVRALLTDLFIIDEALKNKAV